MTDPKDIGILSSLTEDYNFEGKLFTFKDDFIVQEIEEDSSVLSTEKEQDSGNSGDKKSFITATLVKEGMSTHEALSILARENHLSIKRVGYLGNKDRNAITSQRVSIFKGTPDNIKKEYRKMFLRDIVYSDIGCKIGALKGNRFTIRIRDFNGFDRLDDFIGKVSKGVPNFYGPQHFGSSSLNIPVSKAIIQRDFKKAVSEFVFAQRNESDESAKGRSLLKNTFYDYVQEDKEIGIEQAEASLSEVPGFLHYEKNIIRHLLKNKHDFIGALRIVPKFLRLLILQSFQAYIFNLTVSKLIKDGKLPEEIPVIGYDIGDSIIENTIKSITESQGVEDISALDIKEMPEVSLKSFSRPAKIYPKNIKYHREENNLILSFDLDKGAYATVFLFEMFKHF